MAILAGLTPRDPRFVLLELSKLAAAGKNPPRVSIDTAEGNRYQGVVVGVEEHQGSFFVLLENDKAYSGNTTQATYLDLRNAFQLTILDAPEFLPFMQFGEVSRWSKDEAMTSLTFKRWLEPIIQKFQTRQLHLEIDPALSAEGVGQNVLRDVIQGLVEYYSETQIDPIGAEALQKINLIKLQATPETPLHVQRNGQTLVIGLDTKLGLPAKKVFSDKLNAVL